MTRDELLWKAAGGALPPDLADAVLDLARSAEAVEAKLAEVGRALDKAEEDLNYADCGDDLAARVRGLVEMYGLAAGAAEAKLAAALPASAAAAAFERERLALARLAAAEARLAALPYESTMELVDRIKELEAKLAEVERERDEAGLSMAAWKERVATEDARIHDLSGSLAAAEATLAQVIRKRDEHASRRAVLAMDLEAAETQVKALREAAAALVAAWDEPLAGFDYDAAVSAAEKMLRAALAVPPAQGVKA